MNIADVVNVNLELTNLKLKDCPTWDRWDRHLIGRDKGVHCLILALLKNGRSPADAVNLASTHYRVPIVVLGS